MFPEFIKCLEMLPEYQVDHVMEVTVQAILNEYPEEEQDKFSNVDEVFKAFRTLPEESQKKILETIIPTIVECLTPKQRKEAWLGLDLDLKREVLNHELKPPS